MNFSIESEPETAYINGIRFFLQKTSAYDISAAAHIHDTIEILFVKQGSFVVCADAQKYEIFAGDMILFRSNVIHHIFAGSGAVNSYYVLKIRPGVVRDIAAHSTAGMYLLNFVFKKSNSKCIWSKEELKDIKEITYGFDCLKKEFEEKQKYSDIAFKLAAGNILLGILRSYSDTENIHLPENTNRTADCIYKAMAYINNNYSDDITENDVSAAAGLSYHYFSRTFKLVTGKSFKEYLNITRVNHAERLLVTTDKNVSVISSECGYNDVSYFIKVYKRIKHTSPGKTRFQKNALTP